MSDDYVTLLESRVEALEEILASVSVYQFLGDFDLEELKKNAAGWQEQGDKTWRNDNSYHSEYYEEWIEIPPYEEKYTIGDILRNDKGWTVITNWGHHQVMESSDPCYHVSSNDPFNTDRFGANHRKTWCLEEVDNMSFTLVGNILTGTLIPDKEK